MESVFMVRKGCKIESNIDFSGSYVMEVKLNANQVWFIVPGKNMSKGGSISFYARKVNKEGEIYGPEHYFSNLTAMPEMFQADVQFTYQ